VQDRLADINPVYWLFWLGILLIGTTLFLRRGVVGGLLAMRDRRQRARSDDPA
jgi:branched-chain amino acid transport system permease protein